MKRKDRDRFPLFILLCVLFGASSLLLLLLLIFLFFFLPLFLLGAPLISILRHRFRLHPSRLHQETGRPVRFCLADALRQVVP